jgi:MFS family permease
VRLLSRIVDVIAPPRLGRGFRWLFSAALINNIGDGIALAAGPLLIASQTRDPFLVSLALLMQQLPTFLFGFIGGAFADRWDRRRMVMLADGSRALILGVLTLTIVTGTVNIALVFAALFLMGTSEVMADSASSTMIPNLVAREDYGIANARMQGAFVLTNELLTPPIGAFLFVVGMALPFAANAACYALGVVLVSRVVLPRRERRPNGQGTTIVADVVEGIRWLIAHPAMRTLSLTILAFNVTFGAAWSVLVLFAIERLGMSELGYGLLTTAIAIGGVIGTFSYGALERRFSLANIMRVGLLIETFTHLIFAITTSQPLVFATLIVFGAHEFVWGATSTVVRQRAVPDEVLGRVGGVYRVAIIGGHVVGTPIGGALAKGFGLTAPFWFGFVGSAILVALLWRQFEHIAHAGDVQHA